MQSNTELHLNFYGALLLQRRTLKMQLDGLRAAVRDAVAFVDPRQSAACRRRLALLIIISLLGRAVIRLLVRLDGSASVSDSREERDPGAGRGAEPTGTCRCHQSRLRWADSRCPICTHNSRYSVWNIHFCKLLERPVHGRLRYAWYAVDRGARDYPSTRPAPIREAQHSC